MKIVFLIYRINYYRIFAPLIQEGLNRGYEIECWHDYSLKGKTGFKSHIFPSVEAVPRFESQVQPKTRIFHGEEGLKKELSAQKDIDAVASIHAPNYCLSQEALRSFSARWLSVFPSSDFFVKLIDIPKERLEYKISHTLFLPSRYYLGLGRSYLENFSSERSFFLKEEYTKCESVGMVEFDGFRGIDPQKARDKFKIPGNKSILLYLPFPYLDNSVWENAFCGILTNTSVAADGSYMHDKKKPFLENLRHKGRILSMILKNRQAFECWLKGENEARVFTAVRRFCDKNNLYLVVKPRLKFPLAEIVKRDADLVVWDTEMEQNPPALKELLTLAKLTVAFFSSAVLTSAFAKVFHLNINLPDDYFNYKEIEKFWYPTENESVYHFPGVCENWGIKDVIQSLENTSLDYFTVNLNQRQRYIDKYIGYDDFSSSRRLYDSLEKQFVEKIGFSVR